MVVVSTFTGLAVMLLGAAILPESPNLSQADLNSLAEGSMDPAQAAGLNRAVRFPSRLLVWGVIPVAALVIGVVAGTMSRQKGLVLAPLSFSVIWVAVLWGAWPDMKDLLFGSLYASASVLGAGLSLTLRSNELRLNNSRKAG